MGRILCDNQDCVYNLKGDCRKETVVIDNRECNDFLAGYGKVSYMAAESIFMDLFNVISRVGTSTLSDSEYKSVKEFSRWIHENYDIGNE